MGQPGYVLYPGGYAKNYRSTGFELEGAPPLFCCRCCCHLMPTMLCTAVGAG